MTEVMTSLIEGAAWKTLESHAVTTQIFPMCCCLATLEPVMKFMRVV